MYFSFLKNLNYDKIYCLTKLHTIMKEKLTSKRVESYISHELVIALFHEGWKQAEKFSKKIAKQMGLKEGDIYFLKRRYEPDQFIFEKRKFKCITLKPFPKYSSNSDEVWVDALKLKDEYVPTINFKLVSSYSESIDLRDKSKPKWIYSNTGVTESIREFSLATEDAEIITQEEYESVYDEYIKNNPNAEKLKDLGGNR